MGSSREARTIPEAFSRLLHRLEIGMSKAFGGEQAFGIVGAFDKFLRPFRATKGGFQQRMLWHYQGRHWPC
jgi:hypothetical protein